MTDRIYIAAITALTAITFSAGCGPKAGFGIVEGIVTVDGIPAESGHINFFPVGGAANPVGAKIVNGEYALEVPIGESKVEVRVPKVVGERRLYSTPDSPVKAIRAESLPPKFNSQSELTLKVRPGKNRQDYHLESK